MTRSRTKLLAVALAATTLAAGGAAFAASRGFDEVAAEKHGSRDSVTTSALNDFDIDAHFVPIAPCRIVDTRKVGFAIPAGATRSFFAAGETANPYGGQGGNADGCPIPASASAIQATVTSILPAGNGFARLWASLDAEPNATFFNYSKAFNVAGSGVVPITPGGDKDFKIKSFTSASNYVVDVTGYYIQPLYAVVSAFDDPDDDPDAGVEVSVFSASSRLADFARIGAGEYVLTWDRDVTYCAASATVEKQGFEVAAVNWLDTTTLAVTDSTGAAIDEWVDLVVTC